jgi:transposase
MRRTTRGYRIRIYPNGAQSRLRDRWFGAYRWLWNTALEIRTAAYQQCGLTLIGNDISLWLTQWKNTQGHAWLREVLATCLIQCLRDQDAAFRKLAESLPSVDRPDMVTLTLDAAGRYFVSFCAEVDKAPPPFSGYCPAVGVDLLRVDAGAACPEEILAQVLAGGDGVQFTRSGRCNRACLEQATLH